VQKGIRFMRPYWMLAALVLMGCAGTLHSGLIDPSGVGPYEDPSARAQAFAHYMTGYMHEQNHRLEAAADEMRQTVDLAPGAVAPALRLIHICLRQEDFEGALAAGEQATAQWPDAPGLWILLGEIYHRLDRYDDAVAAFEKAIALDPESGLGYGRLLELDEATNDLVAAIDIYERLIALRPNLAGLHWQLGLNLARINDTAGARAALEKALELQPTLVRPRFVLGIVYLESDENEKAQEQFAAVVADQPDNLRARENLAGALGRLGRYRKALAQSVGLVAQGAEEPRYTIEMTYLLLRAGQDEQASEVAAPTAAPIFGTLLHALARKGVGTPYRAILDSLDTLEGDVDVECTNILNELLFLFGEEDTGAFFLSALEAARDEGIHSKTLELIRARILIAQERHEEAEKVLLAALDRFGADKDAHYYLATVYEALDRFGPTERHLLARLALTPDDPEVLNFLGYLYAVENVKLDEAERLLTRALDTEPDNAFYLDSMGWIYYRKGDADRAVEYIRKAILTMDNDDGEVRDHLGDAYLLQGDVERAVAEWERARRLDPSREGIQEKIDRQRGQAP